MHQKPLHVQPSTDVDRTKSSRKRTLEDEYSISHYEPESSDVNRTKSSRKRTLQQEYESGEFTEHNEMEDAQFAQSLYEQILSESRFVSPDNLAQIPRFSQTEVIEGLTLGKGGFGTINAVKGFSLNVGKERQIMNTALGYNVGKTMHVEEKEARNFIATHCHRSNGDARYAVKRLQRQIMNDKSTCLQGMTDLANETLFLGSIEHPAIIKLRGIAKENMMSKDFFLVLDRVYDTLATRLVKWKTEDKKRFGLKWIFRKNRVLRRRGLLADRLSYATNLTSALAYLHQNGCLHRDLKPENIGFDVRGDIKIFDFGLARELPKKTKTSCSTFHLTKDAGTPRYMAPEVATGRYNEACDIYSMGLILWEFITLKRPFKEQKFVEDFDENVWSPDGLQCRPKIPQRLSPGLNRLLNIAWNHSIDERPSAIEFESTLCFEIAQLRATTLEKETDFPLHSHPGKMMRRRSTFLFIPGKGEAANRDSKLFETLSKSDARDGAILDAFGASSRTYLTQSDRFESFESFRSLPGL